MAADEVLLESATDGIASLRFYGWSRATLSLGYFQSESVPRQDPRLSRLPFVRRPSGGATLVHDNELTYAVALPPGPEWQARNKPPAFWLERIHLVIASALEALGIHAQLSPGREPPAFTGFLCFEHVTAGDLVIGHDKVVGSAQRRRRGALLQHGAILLAASPHVPDLRGLRELAGKQLTPREIADAGVKELARATGWSLSAGDWTASERRRIGELVESKYTQDAWNGRR
jgi:lipoate-protein ligase A